MSALAFTPIASVLRQWARAEAPADPLLEQIIGNLEWLREPPKQIERSQFLKIAAGVRLALEALRLGNASGEQFGWVVNAANIGLMLTELGFGDEADADAFRLAQGACMRAISRHQRVGRFVLDGPGYLAVVAALELHESQLECPELTDKLMVQALQMTKQRIEDGQFLVSENEVHA